MKKWTLPVILMVWASCNNGPAPQSAKTAGMYPPALQELLKKADAAPEDVQRRQELIYSLDTAGLYREALVQLDLLISKDSFNHEYWFQKARFTEQLKDTTAAIRYYSYSTRLHPAPPAMLSLANLLAEKKDTAAITLCSNINTLFPGKEYAADVFFIRGIYHARKGHTSQAIIQFDSCIYRNYRYLEAYMEKGFLLSDRKQIRPAMTIFATVLKLDPLYTDAYYWMGKSFEQLGIRDTALYNYQKAIALDPELKEAISAINRLK
ncbi:MAG TPA: tetratricopeptide repeat protein [Sediminibacterium sp.]|nr:tetratricopeptide repeat protein [Sediminibacterium sp.]